MNIRMDAPYASDDEYMRLERLERRLYPPFDEEVFNAALHAEPPDVVTTAKRILIRQSCDVSDLERLPPRSDQPIGFDAMKARQLYVLLDRYYAVVRDWQR